MTQDTGRHYLDDGEPTQPDPYVPEPVDPVDPVEPEVPPQPAPVDPE